MSRDTIRLPHDAYWLLQTLRAAGHSAYVVGGCVRDSLLGRMPGDWDICTSARPDEMRALFHDQRMILTGEKHGTVAVILHGKPYEMTTYRLDGSYRDHRHPDSVQFVDDLAEDLARRDFTINAMAYAPGEGIIDLYGGRRDLAAGIVRCVGTPADPLDLDDNYAYWLPINELTKNEKRFAITHLLDDDLINYFESEKINILFTCDDNHNITNMEIKEA